MIFVTCGLITHVESIYGMTLVSSRIVYVLQPRNGGWAGDWRPFHIRATWTVWEGNRKKPWFKLFTRKSLKTRLQIRSMANT